ncbi:MAG: alpha/beta hydrolase [Rhodospirillales bacterium]|nr:alpha/beta hydrolase [Rhodospirillales bacterium]
MSLHSKRDLKRPLARSLAFVIFTVLVVYFSLVAVLYVKQRDFIYFPDKTVPNKALVNSEGASRDIEVQTEDGLRLHGWFIESARTGMPVIVFFHGNTGNMSNRLHKISDYLDAGYGVLMAEYRGYGGNPGLPGETGLYHDAAAYFKWLNEAGYADRDLILYGESLGSGVAVEMAMRHDDVKALILETPYARLSDPARKTYFFIPFIHNLMHDRYESIEKIHSVKAPKLFIIAGRDEVLGSQTGLNLYKAAPEPKTLKIFEQALHNTAYQHGAGSHVLLFLSTL